MTGNHTRIGSGLDGAPSDEGARGEDLNLTHAEAFPWRMQDFGLLGLWLDDRREHRLHVWAPEYLAEDPPIHDHPFDVVQSHPLTQRAAASANFVV